MLRLEQGFPEEVFTSSDSAMNGYATHHIMLVQTLAAADVLRDDGLSPIAKIESVRNGQERSRTLVLAKTALHAGYFNDKWIDVRTAHMSEEWGKIKAEMSLDTHSNWRIQKREDEHVAYPHYSSFSVTRTIARSTPGETVHDDQFRLRERYTIIARSYVIEDDIRDFFEADDNSTDFLAEELLLASVTVYALNKAIQKPQVAPFQKQNRFEELAASERARHMATRKQ